MSDVPAGMSIILLLNFWSSTREDTTINTSIMLQFFRKGKMLDFLSGWATKEVGINNIDIDSPEEPRKEGMNTIEKNEGGIGKG